MRDYSKFDKHLNNLSQDVYAQPEDSGHTHMARRFSLWIKNRIGEPAGVVLDAGCGNGFCQEFFPQYVGIGFGNDIQDGKKAHRNVMEMDFSFLTFSDDYFDVVLSRHSLEHSPFPVITLMEWHRVSRRWLALCVPNPDHYTYTGRNHYSVANAHQIAWWLRRSGWMIQAARKTPTEYWFLCRKMPIIGYEGWATTPLDTSTYEFERDLFKKESS